MNIKDTLATLLSYYRATHGCGHTSALLVGVSNSPDCLVLVADRAPALPKIKPARIVSLNRTDLSNGLIGVRAPMLADNSAMEALLSASLTEILRLERRVDRLQKRPATPEPEPEVVRPTAAEPAA